MERLFLSEKDEKAIINDSKTIERLEGVVESQSIKIHEQNGKIKLLRSMLDDQSHDIFL